MPPPPHDHSTTVLIQGNKEVSDEAAATAAAAAATATELAVTPVHTAEHSVDAPSVAAPLVQDPTAEFAAKVEDI
jgi:hypothetical protein